MHRPDRPGHTPARVEAAWLGRRVTLRHLLAAGDPSGRGASDVVGRLASLDDVEAVVERRDGRRTVVPLADVLLARVVPDRPLRVPDPATTDAETLQRVCLRGWPAVEAETLGDWVLRASDGFTRRANALAVTGDPGLDWAEATAVVRGWYAARGLPPRAQVRVGSDAERRLVALGWAPDEGSVLATVQVARVDAALAAAGAIPPADAVELRPDPTPGWVKAYPPAECVDPATVRAVLAGQPTVAFASVAAPGGSDGTDDAPAAIGRGVVLGTWCGLSCVEVAPERRRQGHGRAVVAALLAWAREHGAASAYLETVADNEPALGLYAGLGFVDHHDYTYLTAPPPCPAP